MYVECLGYSDLIGRYDGPQTFFYIDPPYWDTEKVYGKDIFTKDDFGKLAAQLAGIKGKFLLSLNDVPQVREAFSAFEIEALQTKYTCSNKKLTGQKTAGEVLIRNY